nr:hypothetical protein [Lachnospiraceae bacterium]
MDQLLKLLKQRETELKKALVKAESDDIPSPEGHLRLAGRGNNVKYYHVTKPGDTRGSYIAKKDHRLAIALAQKEYHNKFLIKAKEELSLISSCYHRLSAGNADSLFLNMTPARQNLIMPYIITDGLFAKNWQDQSIKTNTFKEEEKVYDTRRGEKVRS